MPRSILVCFRLAQDVFHQISAATRGANSNPARCHRLLPAPSRIGVPLIPPSQSIPSNPSILPVVQTSSGLSLCHGFAAPLGEYSPYVVLLRLQNILMNINKAGAVCFAVYSSSVRIPFHVVFFDFSPKFAQISLF